MLLEVVNEEPTGAREMSLWREWVSRLHGWFRRTVMRRLPRLVWPGDEIDVRITFKGIGALSGGGVAGIPDFDDPGLVFEAHRLFRAMGIGFDTGSNCDGRDWEWDWSLSGPISVRFRSRAKNPERRIPEPPRPELNIIA